MVWFVSVRHAVESPQKTTNLNVFMYWTTILLFACCCCCLLLKDDSSISISDYRLKGSMTDMIDPSKNEVNVTLNFTPSQEMVEFLRTDT